MIIMTYYEILEVANTASQEIIKIAYKNLAKKYHPDTSKDANATEKMQQINEAYSVLSDVEKRKEYDNFLNTQKKVPNNRRKSSKYTNIDKILLRVCRMYPLIIDNENLQYCGDFNLRESKVFKKVETVLDIPNDYNIYILYYDEKSIDGVKISLAMAVTDFGIIHTGNLGLDEEYISWIDFKKKGVSKWCSPIRK